MNSRTVCRTICLGILLLLVSAKCVAAGERVPRWGIFELTLQGPSTGNPFADVSISASFIHDKDVVRADGFFDGQGVYKIRFMPAVQGDWTYTTISNRPELTGKTGGFACVEPDVEVHGPVKVANVFHFAYADGTPYFCIGTTCYNWVFQTDAIEEQTLATFKGSPFNKVRMFVLPSDAAAPPKKSLRYPFAGTAPKDWDFSRFDLNYFRHIENRIANLRDLNIQADLILFNPYEKGRLGFDRMTPAQEDQYLHYAIARFSAYRNVWWSIANEFDLMKNKTDSDWDHYFHIVESADPYEHLRSIHHSNRLYNYSLPWVTHASLQNGSAVEDFGRAVLYRDVYNKPIVMDEVKYEGNFPQRWGQLSGEEMVGRFWQGVIAGVYVGHGEVFKDQPTVWTSDGGVLHGQSEARIAFLKTVVDAGPPGGIDPIDKWQDVHTAGRAGDYYLVYFGSEKPDSWTFELPAKSLKAGMRFHADILDTWNMTITPVNDVFTIITDGKYRFHAEQMPTIKLPGKPYQAIRLTAVKPTK